MTQPLIRVLQIESDELNLRIHTVIQTDVLLDEISDVVAPTPTLGEALLWSGSPQQWRPGVVAGSGTGGSGIISTAPQVGDLVVYGEGNAGSPIGSPVTYRNQSTIQFINDRFLVKGVTATNFGSPRFDGSPQVLIAGSPANKTSLEITSSVPGLMFYDTDAPANEKSWRFVVDDGDFIGEIRSDSGKTANHWIELTRSGNAISDLQLYVGQQEQAIHAIAGAAVEFYHNNINVAETTTAAGGGLRVNNLATGAGFERVLTTSDISSGGGSAGSPLLNIRGGDGIDVTFGSPKVSIAVDGTVARLAGSPITTINSDSFALNQTLRIYDGGNTDYADFSHDGTDFNTAFTNTTDWNITESGVDITVPGAGGARTEQVVVRGAHTTAGSGEGKALFEINQSTASGNTPVFAVYRTGTNLLNLDNDGDLTVSQSIGIGSGFVISNNAVAQYIAYNQAGANQGHLFHTTSAILTRGRVTMGQYTANTEVLTSSQDFNELTIRRDWDGGAGSPLTNTSAGASLRIERDIINSTDTGTFLEWADDTLGELGYIDKDGVLNIGGSPAILLTTTAGAGGLQVRNTLTGTGLERVLTTSDLDTGSPLGLPNIVGGAGITVTTGSPQFTVDVDATVLRTTSSITDLADVDTAGVLENQVLTYAGSPLGWIPVTGAGGSGGGDSVFAGDGISIAAGSPLSNKTISVNTTVLRTSSNLDDLANVIGSPTVTGDTLYFDGTNWNTLAAGTNNQVLTMGSPLLPKWKDPASATSGGDSVFAGTGITVTAGSPLTNKTIAVDATVVRQTGSPTGSPVTIKNTGEIWIAPNFGDAVLHLAADPSNTVETDTAYIVFEQDGAVVKYNIGTAGDAGEVDAEGNVMLDAPLNTFAFHQDWSPAAGQGGFAFGVDGQTTLVVSDTGTLVFRSATNIKTDSWSGTVLTTAFTGGVTEWNITGSDLKIDEQQLYINTGVSSLANVITFQENAADVFHVIYDGTGNGSTGNHLRFGADSGLAGSWKTNILNLRGDGQVTFGSPAYVVIPSGAVGSPPGGMYVRNLVTGTGLERVLTTSDLTSAGSPTDQLHVVGGDGITTTYGSPEVTVAVDGTVLRTTSSITDLADVDTSGVLENQVLTYAGSPLGWIPVTGAAGGSGGDSVFAGDGISIASGSPLSNKTISVDTSVLRTSSNLDDLANVIGSPTVTGDTLYFDGTNWNTLAAGTAGQILTMGSPLLPTWKPNQGASGGGSPFLDIRGGTGITVAFGSPRVTITNSDPNVDQNLWLNIASDVGGPVAANTTTDTLTLAGGTRIRTNISGDTVTINMTGSPVGATNVVGGDGITVTTGSPEVTVAVDATVFRTTNTLDDISDVVAGSPTIGAILYNDGTNWLKLARGLPQQVLTMGSPLLPSWKAASSGGGGGSPVQNIVGGDGITVTLGSPVATISVDSTVARLGPGSPPNGSPSQVFQNPNTFLNDTTFEVNPTTVDGTGVKRPVGLGVLPPYEIDTNATFDTAHTGMVWHVDAGSPAVTFTAPNDTTIEVGSMWQVQNDDVENVTIAAGSPSVTILRLGAGGAPVSGNVLVQQGGIVSIYKYTDTEYWLYGDSEAIGFGSPISADFKGLIDVSITGGAGSPKLPELGDTLYYDGTNWVNLPRGTNGQVLNMGSPLLPSWKTLDVGDLTGSPVALPNIVGGTGISVATGSPQFTITNSDPNVDQNLFDEFRADSGNTVAAGTNEKLTIAGGVGINTSIGGSPVTLTITNTLVGSPASYIENVVGGDGITVTTGSPQVTIAVDATVFRTTDTLGDISNVTGSPTTLGDTFYYDGANWTNLARGTSGQSLRMGTGSPNTPTWTTPIDPNGQGISSRTTGASWANPGSTITVPVDDVFVYMPTNTTILGITILGESVSGSCKVDVYKDILANYPPTVADTIVGSPLPGITAGRTFNDTTLTGWTTAVNEGDVLGFHLQETSSFEQIYVQLELQTTIEVFGSPLPPNVTSTNVVGGDGITVTTGSPEVTVAVDSTVARDGDNISIFINDANYLKTIGSPLLDIRGGTGIDVTFGSPRVTITNSDPNVDQNLWLNIAGDVGGPVAANTTTDTLTFAGGKNVRTNIAGDTITVNMTGSPFTSSGGGGGSPVQTIRGGDGIDVTFGSPIATIAVDETVARMGVGSPVPTATINEGTFSVAGSPITQARLDINVVQDAVQIFRQGTSIGEIVIGDDNSTTVTATTVRIPTTAVDVSTSSSGHPFQIGESNTTNLRMDGSEIQSAFNGGTAALSINPLGGNLTFGAATPTLAKTIRVYGSDTGGIQSYFDDGSNYILRASRRDVRTGSPAVRFNIASWVITTFRSVEVSIQATAGNNYHKTTLTAIQGGSPIDVNWTEYGTITIPAFFGSPNVGSPARSGEVATYDFEASTGQLRLYATPRVSGTITYLMDAKAITIV